MKRRKLWVSVMAGIMAGVMLLTLIVSLIPVRAHAKSSSEIQGEIDALQEQQNQIQADMEALQEKQNANKSETADCVERKSAVDQQIALLHTEINNINDQISAFNQMIADKQDTLDAATRKLNALNEKNRERIRVMEEEGTVSYWSVLFHANSFSDFLDRLNMVQEIAEADHRRIQEMNVAADEVAQAREDLQEQKESLEQTKLSLNSKQEELTAKKQEAEDLLAELVAKSSEMADQMTEYAARKNEFVDQLGQAEKEYNEAKQREWDEAHPPKPEFKPEPKPDPKPETKPEPEPDHGGETDSPDSSDQSENSGNSSDSSSGSSSGGSSDSYWMVPCDYVYVSGTYGWRDAPTEGASTFHSGVDLAGPEGTPIYASRSGEVTRGGYNEYNGNFVGINHGDGYSSVYLHMTYAVVDIGEYVEQGQLIGYMGATGIATGPHLHFTIYYNGETVNPAEYIAI